MPRTPATRARQRGFFDFSVTELAIIFAVALMVLGPKKLPGLVAQIGRWVGRARHMARQFREQLEQEVNSINAVKPIPRHVPPPVTPATPAPEVAAASAPAPVNDHPPAPQPEAAAHDTAPAPGPVQETHPEAQIYFALNGSEPEVVTENPYGPQPDPAATATAEHPQGTAAAAAEPAAPGPGESASVKVIFPHDHG
jgi:sec-independent protein translocase protein TatB